MVKLKAIKLYAMVRFKLAIILVIIKYSNYKQPVILKAIMQYVEVNKTQY